jgi:endonuclease/exonuclease/phosphatase family metal-dependent hydrolase
VVLRILTYNIRRGGKGHEEALAQTIRACTPDLVILQEASDPEVVNRLAANTGMAQCASRKGNSLGFLSRTRVASFGWHKPRISRHAFLEIELPGTEARIFGIHLSAVHAAWTERRRTEELRALLKSIARHQHGFHVLTGDFNTLAPGELLDFRKLPGRLRALVWLSGGEVRWRTIQIILDAGYVDAYRLLHTGVPGFTFPTWDPHVRLDYLFLPARYVPQLRSVEIMDVPGARDASDHLPLLSVVDIPDAATEPVAGAALVRDLGDVGMDADAVGAEVDEPLHP